MESHQFRSIGKLLNQSAGDVAPLTPSVNMTLSKALKTQLLCDAIVCCTDFQDTTKYSLEGEHETVEVFNQK